MPVNLESLEWVRWNLVGESELDFHTLIDSAVLWCFFLLSVYEIANVTRQDMRIEKGTKGI